MLLRSTVLAAPATGPGAIWSSGTGCAVAAWDVDGDAGMASARASNVAARSSNNVKSIETSVLPAAFSSAARFRTRVTKPVKAPRASGEAGDRSEPRAPKCLARCRLQGRRRIQRSLLLDLEEERAEFLIGFHRGNRLRLTGDMAAAKEAPPINIDMKQETRAASSPAGADHVEFRVPAWRACWNNAGSDGTGCEI